MGAYHDRADAKIRRCEECDEWAYDSPLCAGCRRREAGL